MTVLARLLPSPYAATTSDGHSIRPAVVADAGEVLTLQRAAFIFGVTLVHLDKAAGQPDAR